MCNPLMLLSTGLQVVSAVSSKKAADKAAAKAQEAGDFNAEMIERDIDLLEKIAKHLQRKFSCFSK